MGNDGEANIVDNFWAAYSAVNDVFQVLHDCVAFCATYSAVNSRRFQRC